MHPPGWVAVFVGCPWAETRCVCVCIAWMGALWGKEGIGFRLRTTSGPCGRGGESWCWGRCRWQRRRKKQTRYYVMFSRYVIPQHRTAPRANVVLNNNAAVRFSVQATTCRCCADTNMAPRDLHPVKPGKPAMDGPVVPASSAGRGPPPRRVRGGEMVPRDAHRAKLAGPGWRESWQLASSFCRDGRWRGRVSRVSRTGL
jgi:hypothetical protein